MARVKMLLVEDDVARADLLVFPFMPTEFDGSLTGAVHSQL